MKHIIGLALIIVFMSCNGNSDSTATSSDSSSQTEAGRVEIGRVENVNGGIPDTINTGATPQSGTNMKAIDSSYADTVNKVK